MKLNVAWLIAVAVAVLGTAGRVGGETSTDSAIISNQIDWSDSAQASWNSARAGAMSLRAPGNVVSRARAQFMTLHDTSISRILNGPDITETKPDLTLAEQVRVKVLETLFSSLESTLAELLPLLVPGGGSSTDGGTTTDADGLATTGDPTDLLGTITGE